MIIAILERNQNVIVGV